MRFLCAVAMVAMTAAAPVRAAEPARPTAAADGHALLQRGVAQHREAAYAASVALLEQARARGDLQPHELAEAAFYLAANYVAMGSLPAARRELRTVLENAPTYELPQYTSPKVAALFRDVRDEQERAPRLRPLPPRHKSATEIEIGFEASRTQGTAYGSAYWRFRGERGWREAPLGHVGERLMARLEVERDGTLEYWAEVRAPGGAALAGSKDKPLELPVTGAAEAAAIAKARGVPLEPPQQPKRWWPVALGVGLVFVGAGLGVGLGLGLGLKSTPPTGDAILSFEVR
jgi:hypothetical protein